MQKDNDKGFALLEILGGLVVISLLMPLFWSYIEDYLNEMRNQSAAFHADADAITEKLKMIDYEYDETQNQFV